MFQTGLFNRRTDIPAIPFFFKRQIGYSDVLVHLLNGRAPSGFGKCFSFSCDQLAGYFATPMANTV